MAYPPRLPAVSEMKYVEAFPNSNGVVAIPHGLGRAPKAVVATPAILEGGIGVTVGIVHDSLTATDFKVRAMISYSTPKNGGGIRVHYIAYDDEVITDPPPSGVQFGLGVSGLSIQLAIHDIEVESEHPDSQPYTYIWDFGDGTPVVESSTVDSADHTYAAAGTYTVALTVKDAQNRSASATQEITVVESTPPPEG